MPTETQRGTRLVELVEVMRRLLSPQGCPWDREQTLETLKPYAVEEVYEVLEAIEAGDVAGHCEELGDLLLQVVFQAELRAAEGHFGIDDVVDAITRKLVRRHPHVFGDLQVSSSEEVLANWKRIKADEQAGKAVARGLLDGVPHALPALLQAERIGEKAAEVGFDWPDVGGVRDKISEELGELDAALQTGDRAAIAAELGDLLFALTRLGRKLEISSEEALRQAIARFRRRFAHMQQAAVRDGRLPDLSGMTLDDLEQLWQAAKVELAQDTDKDTSPVTTGLDARRASQ